MLKKLFSAAAMMVVLGAGSAGAATFAGKFYDVGGFGVFNDPSTITGSPLANSNAAVLDFLAGNPTPDATFTSAAIGYGAQSISDLGTFLGSDAASLSGGASTSFLGTILTFSGTINLLAGNNAFEVFSDDGFLLYINNVLVGNFDGLRPPSSSTFDVDGGAGGNAAFSLIYYEGSQVLAALDVKVNGKILAPVPLPAGGLLLLGAIGGIAALRRRKAA